MNTILTREGVLVELAKVGKDIANMARPNYWSFEDMGRAKDYAVKAEALRKIYHSIQNGGDVRRGLEQAIKVVQTGIECNMLNLILTAATKGFEPGNCRIVENDQIVWKG